MRQMKHTNRRLAAFVVAALAVGSVLSGVAATNFWPHLALNAAPWEKGRPQWPSTAFEPRLGDLTRYDRIVVDFYQDGDGGPNLYFYLANGNTRTSIYHRGCPSHDSAQWVFDLAQAKETYPNVVTNLTRIQFNAVRPRKELRVWIDRVTFLEPGEPLPDDEGLTGRMRTFKAHVAARKASDQDWVQREHEKSFKVWRRACERARTVKGAFVLGQASAQEKVRPRAAFTARSAKELKVRLARNEYESVQLLVAPAKEDLKNVRVCADMGKSGFASTNILCSPVGYVRTRLVAPYKPEPGRVETIPGWWPDPILAYTNAADVAGTDVQSFWIRVHCPDGQRAGVYKGAVVVSADGVKPVKVPLTIRVNGFSIPRTSPLPMAITFCPVFRHTFFDEHPIDPEMPCETAPVRAWLRHREKWCDYLADYFISFGSLYYYPPVNRPQFDLLHRLERQGRLGLFNLGYWRKPKSLSDADKEAWRKEYLEPLAEVYAETKREGLLGNAYLYGCDEAKPNEFPAVDWAARELKKAMPEVPTFTTAFCEDFGTNSPLASIDWFTPDISRYVENQKAIAAGRAAGRKMWWYFCNAYSGVEDPAIELRMVMGALAAKYRPDGFLYWQVSVWNVEKPLDGGPWTDWNPRTWNGWNGEGGWTGVGPDSTPIPTIRIENFRDGLEDLWYVRLLEEKTGKSVEVPAELVESHKRFSYDPAALIRWRDTLADAIEKALNGKDEKR